jgi:hypothetical protein
MIAEEIRAVMAAKASALVRRSAADITALLHPEVRLFDATAVATMLLDDHYTVDGREIVETYHALFVFTRVDGRWLWAGGQAMVPRDL